MTIRHSINGVAFGPSVTVTGLVKAFGPGDDFDLVVPIWAIHNEGWELGIERLKSAGRPVACLLHTSWFSLAQPDHWPRQQEQLAAVARAAVAVGARYVYGTSGPAAHMEFDRMADNLARAVAPVVSVAEDLGVRLLLETTNPLRAGLSAIFSLRDLVEICEASGLGLCVDLTSIATERYAAFDLERLAAEISIVQIGDIVPDTLAVGQRAVPGDGELPLARLLGALIKGGFDGILDLEIFGSGIDVEGAREATLRGHARVIEMIDQARSDILRDPPQVAC